MFVGLARLAGRSVCLPGFVGRRLEPWSPPRSSLGEGVVYLGPVTGPLTQATGPPRSGGGVAIGMLRGISLLSAI